MDADHSSQAAFTEALAFPGRFDFRDIGNQHGARLANGPDYRKNFS